MFFVLFAYIEGVGVGSFGCIEHDNAVKFQPLGFVGGCYEETFSAISLHTAAVAQVRLANGVQVGQIEVKLLPQGGGEACVHHVYRKVVNYVLPFGHLFYYALLTQCAVCIFQLLYHDGDLVCVGGAHCLRHAVLLLICVEE